MSIAQRIYFLQDVFQMTTIVYVSVINHYHINRLYLFYFETPCICIYVRMPSHSKIFIRAMHLIGSKKFQSNKE